MSQKQQPWPSSSTRCSPSPLLKATPLWWWTLVAEQSTSPPMRYCMHPPSPAYCNGMFRSLPLVVQTALPVCVSQTQACAMPCSVASSSAQAMGACSAQLSRLLHKYLHPALENDTPNFICRLFGITVGYCFNCEMSSSSAHIQLFGAY